MKILGIETSCDETAIAAVEVRDGNFKIFSHVVSSQVKLHTQWGGVVPALARREHENNLTFVLRKVLREAKLVRRRTVASNLNAKQSKIQTIKKILEREPVLLEKLTTFFREYTIPSIDLIAVVNGPGLEPALWVGVNFAKALAFWWKKQIVPVNHLEGHLLTSFIQSSSYHKPVRENFPAICLLISGGHTMIVLVREIGDYAILGETRDDAAGECFDKTARLLGLGYPGGPAIAQVARRAQSRYLSQIRLPRPMMYSKDYDFSFSGLKTAVLYHYRSQPTVVKKSKNYIYAMASAIQQAIVDVLIAKTIRAAKEYGAKTIMMGGGVAANTTLRNQLQEKVAQELPGVQYMASDVALCGDNGIMAALAGYFAWQRNHVRAWQEIKADANRKL